MHAGLAQLNPSGRRCPLSQNTAPKRILRVAGKPIATGRGFGLHPIPRLGYTNGGTCESKEVRQG